MKVDNLLNIKSYDEVDLSYEGMSRKDVLAASDCIVDDRVEDEEEIRSASRLTRFLTEAKMSDETTQQIDEIVSDLEASKEEPDAVVIHTLYKDDSGLYSNYTSVQNDRDFSGLEGLRVNDRAVFIKVIYASNHNNEHKAENDSIKSILAKEFGAKTEGCPIYADKIVREYTNSLKLKGDHTSTTVEDVVEKLGGSDDLEFEQRQREAEEQMKRWCEDIEKEEIEREEQDRQRQIKEEERRRELIRQIQIEEEQWQIREKERVEAQRKSIEEKIRREEEKIRREEEKIRREEEKISNLVSKLAPCSDSEEENFNWNYWIEAFDYFRSQHGIDSVEKVLAYDPNDNRIIREYRCRLEKGYRESYETSVEKDRMSANEYVKRMFKEKLSYGPLCPELPLLAKILYVEYFDDLNGQGIRPRISLDKQKVLDIYMKVKAAKIGTGKNM